MPIKKPHTLCGNSSHGHANRNSILDIVVQEKLVRIRTQTERTHFLGPLVEDIALQQEAVVYLKIIQRLVDPAQGKYLTIF